MLEFKEQSFPFSFQHLASLTSAAHWPQYKQKRQPPRTLKGKCNYLVAHKDTDTQTGLISVCIMSCFFPFSMFVIEGYEQEIEDSVAVQ